MINTKILLKSISYMFLPTLSILILIFFWFFSITDTINFITSKKGVGPVIRILILIIEIIFVYIIYDKEYEKYLEQEIKEMDENPKIPYQDIDFMTRIYELSSFWDSIHKYQKKELSKDLYLIKRIKK